MNANEVLANRAAELIGEPPGVYSRVHPNDHVNMGQSTNDVFPAATRIALLLGHKRLLGDGRDLAASLGSKSRELTAVLKTGRTRLQDAVPITVGQEFGGYAACVGRGVDDVDQAAGQLEELNVGATAVGTGLNAGDRYRFQVVDRLKRYTGLPLRPSVPEMVNQVCFQVMGCDATVALASEAGQLELNVMMPVIAWNALLSSTILTQAMTVFRVRCIEELTVDAARARELLDRSTATATALSPYLGYAVTAEIAKASIESGRTIRELVLERKLLDANRLDDVLSIEAMTRGGIVGR